MSTSRSHAAILEELGEDLARATGPSLLAEAAGAGQNYQTEFDKDEEKRGLRGRW